MTTKEKLDRNSDLDYSDCLDNFFVSNDCYNCCYFKEFRSKFRSKKDFRRYFLSANDLQNCTGKPVIVSPCGLTYDNTFSRMSFMNRHILVACCLYDGSECYLKPENDEEMRDICLFDE